MDHLTALLSKLALLADCEDKPAEAEEEKDVGLESISATKHIEKA